MQYLWIQLEFALKIPIQLHSRNNKRRGQLLITRHRHLESGSAVGLNRTSYGFACCWGASAKLVSGFERCGLLYDPAAIF
jgi:hypothetical protein